MVIKKRKIVHNDGAPREHLFWDRRGSAYIVVAAFTRDERLLLIKEPKYGVMKRILTLPAGGVELNEDSLTAAKRELAEETGYEARIWHQLKENVIDFADKIAGGEHSFYLALEASRCGEPENSTEVILLEKAESYSLLKGNHPELTLDTAMSLACLGIALLHV